MVNRHMKDVLITAIKDDNHSDETLPFTSGLLLIKPSMGKDLEKTLHYWQCRLVQALWQTVWRLLNNNKKKQNYNIIS